MDPSVQAVHEVLENAEDLSESCKAMLLATLPNTLCVPKDERVPFQARMVEMIGEVVEAQKTLLLAGLHAEEAKIAELEKSRSQLEAEIAKSDAAFKEASDVLSSKRLIAQEADRSSKEASISLADAQAAQAAGDAQITKFETERRELQETLDKSLQSLCGEAFDVAAAAGHRDAVMDVLKRSTQTFESTLLMTLPEALIKPPTERGDFDKMAIDTLRKNLGDHVEKLGRELRASEDGKPALATAVEAATRCTLHAQEAALTACNVVSSAEETQKTAAAGLEAAKEAKRSFEPSLKCAEAQRDAKQVALSHFEENNVKSFASLEGKTASSFFEEIFRLGA
jgi:chromosome segregation ATPase